MKEKKMSINKIITNQTCGKLYLAGEYSILTAGQSAIIKNINLFMTSKINLYLYKALCAILQITNS